jgi:hypothetical protein
LLSGIFLIIDLGTNFGLWKTKQFSIIYFNNNFRGAALGKHFGKKLWVAILEHLIICKKSQISD